MPKAFIALLVDWLAEAALAAPPAEKDKLILCIAYWASGIQEDRQAWLLDSLDLLARAGWFPA